jgi:hypothetical protein
MFIKPPKVETYSGHTTDDRDLLAGILCFFLVGVPLILLTLLLAWQLVQWLGAILFWVGIKIWATLEYWIRNKV